MGIHLIDSMHLSYGNYLGGMMSGPMEGVRVVEFGVWVAGPAAAGGQHGAGDGGVRVRQGELRPAGAPGDVLQRDRARAHAARHVPRRPSTSTAPGRGRLLVSCVMS